MLDEMNVTVDGLFPEGPVGLTQGDVDRLAALHRALAPNAHDLGIIFPHCVIVARIALITARAHPGFTAQWSPATKCEDAAPHEPLDTPSGYDERLLVMGGLVHDIGTYQLIAKDAAADPALPLSFRHNYIQHGLRGYKLLKACGFGKPLARFARNHTGLGLTREAVMMQALDIPVADYVPTSPEEELVMYADKFHTKSDPAEFVSPDRAIRRAAKHGSANGELMGALMERYGVPPLAKLSAEYGMALR